MPKDYISFDGNYRIGELLGKGDIWFSRENEQLEIDFDIVKELFKNTIIPFFDKYSSLETLISNYESGNISKRNAFGASICWQHFNAGFSYAVLNRNEKAIYELNTLIHKYSNDERDWVKKRKSYAQKKLDELLGI